MFWSRLSPEIRFEEVRMRRSEAAIFVTDTGRHTVVFLVREDLFTHKCFSKGQQSAIVCGEG